MKYHSKNISKLKQRLRKYLAPHKEISDWGYTVRCHVYLIIISQHLCWKNRLDDVLANRGAEDNLQYICSNKNRDTVHDMYVFPYSQNISEKTHMIH